MTTLARDETLHIRLFGRSAFHLLRARIVRGFLRGNAKIVELGKFTPEQVRCFHSVWTMRTACREHTDPLIVPLLRPPGFVVFRFRVSAVSRFRDQSAASRICLPANAAVSVYPVARSSACARS